MHATYARLLRPSLMLVFTASNLICTRRYEPIDRLQSHLVVVFTYSCSCCQAAELVVGLGAQTHNHCGHDATPLSKLELHLTFIQKEFSGYAAVYIHSMQQEPQYEVWFVT
jgi:hypothetical protein